MTTIVPSQDDLMRPIDPYPFLPNGNAEQQSEQLETILHIQAHGLAGRLRNMPVKRVVLGLSGGLDSTLALLVAVRASELLKYAHPDSNYRIAFFATTLPLRDRQLV
jgi:NAD+ synthase (glutamine-hydrolysing)